MSTQTLLWIIFSVVVVVMLALDLGVLHRKAHTVGLRESLFWSAVWIVIALVFNAVVYLWLGRQKGLEFLTAYIVERSLSVDNLFVFVLIFSYFAVPSKYHHEVLFWGILGALVMRGAMIAAGVTLLHYFEWVIYLFGAFLVFTGIRLATQKEKKLQPERNPAIRLVRRFLPVTEGYEGGSFFVRRATRLFATPLFIVLIVVETTDLVFAVDSVPAVLSITTDPFIVYTSNVFAILGLRALYFALAGMMLMFRYLHYGLAVILVFVGVKMVLADLYDMPVGIALGGVAGVLAVAVAASILRPVKPGGVPSATDAPEGREKPQGRQ